MKRSILPPIIAAVTVFLIGSSFEPGDALAELPGKINYQGRLTDDAGIPLQGEYDLTFRLFGSPTGADIKWGPETHDRVLVDRGLFSVVLGKDPLTPSLSDAFLNSNVLFLAVTVGDENLWPRQEVTSAGYATRSAQTDAIPKGAIIMWSGSVQQIPAGWALCNGTNGTPDLRGRFIVGYDPTDPEYNTLGAKGGTKAHSLTVEELPAHNHSAATVAAGSHTHTTSVSSVSNHQHTQNQRLIREQSGSDWCMNYNPGNCTLYLSSTNPFAPAGGHTHTVGVNSSGSHTHTVTIANTGSGTPHENRPPYYVLAYLMKL